MKRIILILMIFIGSLTGTVSAFEMSSSNYRMLDSSVNVGGQEGQTSASYQMRESIGEPVVGEAQSLSYRIRSGYQPMLETYLAVSIADGSLQMNPDIGGVFGGQADSQTSFNVLTDSPSGYEALIRSSTSPAMTRDGGGDSFDDYTTTTSGVPDFAWSVDSATSEFGFTPEGPDVVDKFLDDTSTCDIGTSNTTDACWYGFSTVDEPVAHSFSATHTGGTDTVVKFRAESGSDNLQLSGSYSASITVTALPN